jgi:hypothetical protein
MGNVSSSKVLKNTREWKERVWLLKIYKELARSCHDGKSAPFGSELAISCFKKKNQAHFLWEPSSMIFIDALLKKSAFHSETYKKRNPKKACLPASNTGKKAN